MKCFLCVLLITFIVGCEKSQSKSMSTKKEITPAKSSSTHKNELWTYLKEFRGKDKMPTLDEIKKKFGEPSNIMPDSESIMAGYYMKKQKTSLELHKKYLDDSYHKFMEGEDSVAVSKWLFFHKKDNNRYIEIYFRKDKTICGWSWFENVPPGKELGPPE